MITQHITTLSFDRCSFTDHSTWQLTSKKKLIIRLRLSAMFAEHAETTLIELPGCFKITKNTYDMEAASSGWGWNENYSSYADESGMVPVIEASVFLDVPYHPERSELKIGIPLTLFSAESHDLYFVYDGLHLRFLMDGAVIDENFPVGELKTPVGELYVSDAVEKAGFSDDTDKITESDCTRTLDCGIEYYSPAGHNTWAGDVVNFWHNGVYHLIYFFDRHHHGNRWGGGAHYFRQLTTTDFVNWIDHGAIFDLSEEWQSVGTGTMFFSGGKYYFAFGFHTSRVIPDEHLYSSSIVDFYNKNGYTSPVSYDEIFKAEKFPNGANMAVSDDGIRFTLCREMFHWYENPSVYTEPDGSLLMCVGGSMWRAADPHGKWTLEKTGFPPTGTNSVMRNSGECPSFFEKNGYKYIIMGLTGFWRTNQNSNEYFDSAAIGYDIYDGLLVPMAVNCDGRLILAGWLNGIGWGSVIVHRELIQYDDGSLGMRWLDECAPSAETNELSSRMTAGFEYACNPEESEYYEIDVSSGDENGSIVVDFGGISELRIDLARREMQISSSSRGRIPPIHERIHEIDPSIMNPWRLSDTHVTTHDFTIANLRNISGSFKIRLVRKYSRKMHATLIDAEIAGCRTIISNRVGEFYSTIKATATGNAAIQSMSVYKYRDTSKI